ncbi:MAG TPA: glycoside hydrolase family 2 TIM barrel-domain containing protein [Streptosporangiaceae bacterium]|nr:glycoside hydrolase family 2 TIM barrel-domain containing protein [Streptosporangiaceae bacterium]
MKGTGAAAQRFVFSQGWLFGGIYSEGSAAPGFDDRGFARVTVPHTVVPLSWGDWDPASWQDVWIYRRHFDGARLQGGRVFADFDGVMTSATVVLNGTTVAQHAGGYLPFAAELTSALVAGDNVLAVIVDARWLDVPPGGSPDGPAAVDYLQPGGIHRDVTLRVVPEVFLADVFARPADVLGAGRSVRVQATIDAAVVPAGPVTVTAEVRDGDRRLARAAVTVPVTAPGPAVARLSVTGLGEVELWSPETPRLYTVRTRLEAPGAPPHEVEVRTGFREAVFRTDGFYLNGERRLILGLNRHELFPYTGMAAPARLHRRDAEILRRELNCDMVRCSHYPQSPHFLDACDELGLMVWAELPGWQYVGGPAFRAIVEQNVRELVIRDRSRPSVIVWGTRLNESANETGLYQRTRQLADELDGSRPTSGAMNRYGLGGWAQDVYGYDDYRAEDGLRPPLPGVPYLVTEAVGALSGAPLYRWTDTGAVLAVQGRMHARVHHLARSGAGYAGLLGWCAIDYASLNGGDRVWHSLKWPGVLDTFRVPKPGAALYRSQVSPQVRPVIAPMFGWEPGAGGPGPGALIATNCERLELYAGGQHVATARPDHRNYGGLAYPPAVADLTVDGGGRPDLRIDGYVGGALVATARMSADPARDRLALTADHAALAADGSDATRLTFRAVDAYGNWRRHLTGSVALELTGPATLVGDNPFPFGEYGGVGGAFVRTQAGRTGRVRVTARHPALGAATVRLVAGEPDAVPRIG